ncbi:MAG: hypothetical protein MMC33_006317 [Icmadophila ericetorum]|nr:hypothetical protein [Icmadophila ericetorum]
MSALHVENNPDLPATPEQNPTPRRTPFPPLLPVAGGSFSAPVPGRAPSAPPPALNQPTTQNLLNSQLQNGPALAHLEYGTEIVGDRVVSLVKDINTGMAIDLVEPLKNLKSWTLQQPAKEQYQLWQLYEQLLDKTDRHTMEERQEMMDHMKENNLWEGHVSYAQHVDIFKATTEKIKAYQSTKSRNEGARRTIERIWPGALDILLGDDQKDSKPMLNAVRALARQVGEWQIAARYILWAHKERHNPRGEKVYVEGLSLPDDDILQDMPETAALFRRLLPPHLDISGKRVQDITLTTTPETRTAAETVASIEGFNPVNSADPTTPLPARKSARITARDEELDKQREEAIAQAVKSIDKGVDKKNSASKKERKRRSHKRKRSVSTETYIRSPAPPPQHAVTPTKLDRRVSYAVLKKQRLFKMFNNKKCDCTNVPLDCI